jgi:hypothetical protein
MLTNFSLFSNVNIATVLSVEPEANRLPSTFQATLCILELCAENDLTVAFLHEFCNWVSLFKLE